MDNQFKNVKTHARLLSKAMWYEWRMKLLDGLKEGLVQIGAGMEEDAETLSQQERLLDPILPRLTEANSRLQNEQRTLQAQADGLANCDQEELRQSREELASIDEDLQAKLRLVKQLEQEHATKEEGIQHAAERRDEFHAEIKEAERVRQESRGWKTTEVMALQGQTSLTMLPIVVADIARSQCDRAGRGVWLEDRLYNQLYPHYGLQGHSATLLQPVFVPRTWLVVGSIESRQCCY